MAKVKVIHDQEGNTLSVWFDDRQKEYICEETSDEDVLMKDKDGNVIGFEKLNYEFGSINEEGIEYSVA